MVEENYIMLSALQHYLFCPRQCSLIHIENYWEENRLTVQGEQMHERVHQEKIEILKNVIKSRGVYLSSKEYGLSGQADLIEFYRVEENEGGVKISKHSGYWIPFPVEYKRGRPKKDNCDKVQLCAQALCLEEMLRCKISKGALFYGKSKRRMDVYFDEKLRAETVEIIYKVHELFETGITPKPEYSEKCKSCSLVDKCNPKQMEQDMSLKYVEKIFEAI